MFQVYITTPCGFGTGCATKYGRAFKNAKRAEVKARACGGHIQVRNRTVWAQRLGWASDVANALAAEAALTVKFTAKRKGRKSA